MTTLNQGRTSSPLLIWKKVIDKWTLTYIGKIATLRTWKWNDTTHSYMTWLIHMWHDSFKHDVPYVYVTWLVHTLHGSFTRDMTRLLFFFLSGTVAVHMWLDLFIRGTTHLHVTRFVYIWHDFICKCDTTQEATYQWLMSHVRKYRNDSKGNGTMKRRLMNDVWCMLEMCMHECFLCNRMHMLTTLSRESGCTGSL